jgi:type IV pilus assembly protein PilV
MQETNVVLVDKKGVTLVEVLVAMVVLLFVSLAMMQTAMVSIDSNMINVLRTEAISIAEMRMNEARNTSFGSLTAGSITNPVTRNLRNITNFPYNVTRTVIDLNVDNKQINIIVTWTWRDTTYTHSITSIVRRP